MGVILRTKGWWSGLFILLSMAGVAKADEIHCVSLQYPPLIFQGAGGQPEGLALDLVAATLRQMGHTLSVEIYPWARSLTMMQNGERDCIFTIFRSPEREEFLDFNQQSIIPQVVYFYAKKGHEPVFNGDLAALARLRIGTVNKINYGPRFEQARSNLTIDGIGSLEQNFKKLVLGRIDLVPSNFYTASYTLSQPDFRQYAVQLVKLDVPIEVVPSYIGFAKERKLQTLIAGFDIEFKKMLRSGTYRKLLEKYGIEMTPEMQQFLRGR